ncbi:MAG: acyltransferase family protein [Lacisediminihabitans sp.]
MKTPPRAGSGIVSVVPPFDRGIVGGRMSGLDGLRAIAVAAVILYHLSPGMAVGGYLGVDIFFVISGFLITALLLREKDTTGKINLPNFWRRRARRLLPALAILVLSCSTAAWVIGGNVLVDLGRQVLGAATFSSNWLAVAGHRSYFDETAPELFRNLWSLAVEEQFYLVWPLAVLLLILIRKQRIRLAIVVALGVASAIAMALIYLPGADATRVYYGTDTHSFGLAIGAALALLSQHWSALPLSWPRSARWALPSMGTLALGGLVAASALMPADAPLVYQGGLAAIAVITAITIAGAIVPGSLLGRLLDVPPMRWIGERSYGLYLWHWPVFVLVLGALPNWPRLGAGGWALGAIALSITVVASALSYRFIEQPIRKNGFRAAFGTVALHWPTNGPRRLGRVAVTLVVVLAVTGSGFGMAAALQGDPGKSDAELQILRGQAAIHETQSPASPVPSKTVDPAAAAPQTARALPGGDQITAIGDSVMLASAAGLQEAFPGIQINAVVSRQMSQLPSIVQGMKADGTLRPIIIVGLGTNGPIDRASLDEARALVGSRTQLVLVNVQAPRGWTDGVDVALSQYAQRYRDVELANWRDAIASHLDLLARDQIHPGSRGGEIYAGVIKDALQRLAELPPLLGPNEYGLAATPL